MEAEGAGEEAVAQGHLDHVVPVHPGGGEDPGRQPGPVAQVPGGVAHDDGVAGAAGGGVDAHHLPQRHGEHLVGVGPGQVVAGGEGQPGQVLQGLAILGQETELVELLLVELDVLIDPGEGGLETLQLQLGQFPTLHLLRILIEDCHGFTPRLSVFGGRVKDCRIRCRPDQPLYQPKTKDSD